MPYPGTGKERHAAAREAVDLQNTEQNADRLLQPTAQQQEILDMVHPTYAEGGGVEKSYPMPPAALRDTAQTAGGMMPPVALRDTQELIPPPPGPESGPGIRAGDTGVGDAALGEGYEPQVEPSLNMRQDHMARDRSDLNLPAMSDKELQDARGRLVVAMANEPVGSQAEAYNVLLNRIDRALADKEASFLEVAPPSGGDTGEAP